MNRCARAKLLRRQRSHYTTAEIRDVVQGELAERRLDARAAEYLRTRRQAEGFIDYLEAM